MSQEDPAQRSGEHEETDANPSGVALTVLGLLVSLVLIGVVVAATRSCYGSRHPSENYQAVFRKDSPPTAPGPGVQVDPAQTLERVRDREVQKLTSYQWLDAQHQHARIPIERAIDLTLQRGLPQRSPLRQGGGPADASPEPSKPPTNPPAQPSSTPEEPR